MVLLMSRIACLGINYDRVLKPHYRILIYNYSVTVTTPICDVNTKLTIQLFCSIIIIFVTNIDNTKIVSI